MLKQFIAVLSSAALCLSIGVYAEELPPVAAPPVTEQTWLYLDSNHIGSQSILAYSLGGRKLRESAREELSAEMKAGVKEGFASPLQLENGIIQLVKTGQDPFRYQKTDLVSMLYSYENIYREGLDGAFFALCAYDTTAAEVPLSARNSVSSVTDYIVSSQQRTGGFASAADRDPDAFTTARAITALSASRDTPYVASAVNKALEWLCTQQNPDASFSKADIPDCETTAAVLTALRTYGLPENDARFVRSGRTLYDALQSFRQTDGGYAPTIGAPSNVAATEAAVVALYVNATGLSPYLPLDHYPGYTEPQADNKSVAIQFFLGFIALLVVLYLILLLTGWIGRKWGKLPPVQPETLETDADPQTMEINIQMKAEIPDFDSLENNPEKSPADSE